MLESSEMNFESRMVSPQKTENDTDDIEVSLRPKTLSEYIGQDKVKENLSIFIEAAKKEMNRWITSCFTVLRDWAKLLFQLSSLTKWALIYA